MMETLTLRLPIETIKQIDTIPFAEAMAMAKRVFDAYGVSGFETYMGGNMLCELVNLAVYEAMKGDRQ